MSKYRCEKCQKMVKAEVTSISLGDKLAFTIQTNRGRTIRLRSVIGAVSKLHHNGDITLEYRNSGYRVSDDEVTYPDAPSPLTYAFIGTCECDNSVQEQTNG